VLRDRSLPKIRFRLLWIIWTDRTLSVLDTLVLSVLLAIELTKWDRLRIMIFAVLNLLVPEILLGGTPRQKSLLVFCRLLVGQWEVKE
jgi:hypothetical protein